MKTKLLLAFTLLATTTFAAEVEHKMTSQQSRMANCAHESKGLQTQERHHFMSECLKGHALDASAPAKELSAKSDHHEKSKACAAEAARKELHGDERHAFLAACVKG